jgi:hypothetical protein
MVKRIRSTAVVVMAGVLVMSTMDGSPSARTLAAASDVILEWNQVALDATVTAAQGALPQIRSMAIVHVAMHDAVNAITGDYDTYLDVSGVPVSGSPVAAAIGAAHYVLTHLFTAPAQITTFNNARTASLAAHSLLASDPGLTAGETIAAALWTQRSTDGASTAQHAYTAPGAGDPGVWVAVGTAAPIVPGWGEVTTWVIHDAYQYLPEGPPDLESGRYARDYEEVKRLGSATSLARTPEQTNIARFWLASPSPVWNPIAQAMIEAKNFDLPTSARALALMYLAAADASVVCWKAKYLYNNWRPITAIRNGDVDGNPHTIPDTAWSPLLTTPQHPEYISGHSTNSSAMGFVLGAIFGDDPGVPITATSASTPGFERHWTTFSEGVDEVIEARIYGGIHYRTSDEVGARVGRQVAQFVLHHALGGAKKPKKD